MFGLALAKLLKIDLSFSFDISSLVLGCVGTLPAPVPVRVR